MKIESKTTYQTELRTTDSVRLIITKYDSIIRDLDNALKDLSKHEYRKADNDIIAAQCTLSKLLFALRRTEGDELYFNLYKIYTYFKELLQAAALYSDERKIRIVIDYLIKLRDTWDWILYQ